jgi:hypothetical protein
MHVRVRLASRIPSHVGAFLPSLLTELSSVFSMILTLSTFLLAGSEIEEYACR